MPFALTIRLDPPVVDVGSVRRRDNELRVGDHTHPTHVAPVKAPLQRHRHAHVELLDVVGGWPKPEHAVRKIQCVVAALM